MDVHSMDFVNTPLIREGMYHIMLLSCLLQLSARLSASAVASQPARKTHYERKRMRMTMMLTSETRSQKIEAMLQPACYYTRVKR